MNNNTVLMDFLREAVKRLGKRSPKFFRILQLVFGIATTVTGVPQLLTTAGVTLPEPFASLATKTVAIASVMALLISSLTVDDTKNLPLTTKDKQV